MKKLFIFLLAAVLLVLAVFVLKTVIPPQRVVEPVQGFDLHIDERRHVEFDSTFIIHHYCKKFPTGFAECQLYDGDGPDAKLVGIEVVIGKDLYGGLSAEEQKQWHHHAKEIGSKDVDIKLPGLSAEEEANVVRVLDPTYGKIYIIWEPNESVSLAQPKVVIVNNK